MFTDLTNIAIPFLEYKFDIKQLPACMERIKKVKPEFDFIGGKECNEHFEIYHLFLVNKDNNNLTFLAINTLSPKIPYGFVLSDYGDRCLQSIEVVNLIENIVVQWGNEHITNHTIDTTDFDKGINFVYSDIEDIVKNEIKHGHKISIEQAIDWGKMILHAIYDLDWLPTDYEIEFIKWSTQTNNNEEEYLHSWE